MMYKLIYYAFSQNAYVAYTIFDTTNDKKSLRKILWHPSVNLKSSLTFTVEHDSILLTISNRINSSTDYVELFRNSDVIFRGIIRSETISVDLSHEYYCESMASLLYDSLLPPNWYPPSDWTDPTDVMPAPIPLTKRVIKYALYTHNDKQTVSIRKINCGNVTEALNAETMPQIDSYDSVYKNLIEVFVNGTNNGLLVERYDGGMNRIDFCTSATGECSQTIDYGINLISCEITDNGNGCATAIFPIDKDGNTLVNMPESMFRMIYHGTRYSLTSGYITDDDNIPVYGRIEKVSVYDVDSASDIVLRAIDELDNIPAINRSISVRAVDFPGDNEDNFTVGKGVRVNIAPENISEIMVIYDMDIDINNPTNTMVSLNRNKAVLTDMI